MSNVCACEVRDAKIRSSKVIKRILFKYNQGCFLSHRMLKRPWGVDCPLLLLILCDDFMDRFSRRNHGKERVSFGNLGILSLLFANNMVLFVSLGNGFFKSEVIVFNHKKVDDTFWKGPVFASSVRFSRCFHT